MREDRQQCDISRLSVFSSQFSLLSLIFALVAAALLRFAALGQRALWCDELATLQRLGLSFVQHARAMRGNHPLYELLLRFWASPESSDVWLRIPSAALGVLAVWLTWLLLRGIGRSEANVAAWLIALSPLHVMYSRVARAYSLAPALALASSLALVWALKRRRILPLAVYVLATALMIYSNLVAGSVWIAQALFVLWFHRKRVRRLGRWVVAHVAVAALLAPWFFFNFRGAAQFGAETAYTARQLGVAAKACYLPLTFCLGETVNPLNLTVVAFAFLGFGATMVGALRHISRKRNRLAVFLLVQVVVVYVLALCFSAAAPKHLTILLPAWCGLLAIGLVRMRVCWLRSACTLIVLATTFTSLFNYYSGREFADADMVTPWRDMAATVEGSERPGDALIVGYRMDRGAYDMFRRYYRGALAPQYLDFVRWQEQLGGELKAGRRVWLLLHDGDPRREIVAWVAGQGSGVYVRFFQMEEHTLQWIRDGFGDREEYRSPLYGLFLLTPDWQGAVVPPGLDVYDF